MPIPERGGTTSNATTDLRTCATGDMAVPRHPRTGLATVTLLFSGEIDHLDSTGFGNTVRPGEVDLMIAGRSVSHAEFSTASATVFIGSLGVETSPIDPRTPTLAAQPDIPAGTSVEVPLDPGSEHGFVRDTGSVTISATRSAEHDPVRLSARQLAFVPTGTDSVMLTAGNDATRIVLVGAPRSVKRSSCGGTSSRAAMPQSNGSAPAERLLSGSMTVLAQARPALATRLPNVTLRPRQ